MRIAACNQEHKSFDSWRLLERNAAEILQPDVHC